MLLFEEQYQNLWGALDEIAERIRTQRCYAPALVADLMALPRPKTRPRSPQTR